ncbi:hypothetical protein R3P38DRAFT_3620524 [Favolaschia claudopus]|uniref:Shikimate kinase n=1 Tax=Favolaschia claudopus TaxID=2862362 RepID=A0AAW0DED3_9AGAR
MPELVKDDLENKGCVFVNWIAVKGSDLHSVNSTLATNTVPQEASASIILIGMRGSEKTITGHLVAGNLDSPCIDADALFEEKDQIGVGVSPSKLWPAFRVAENALLRELRTAYKENHVISLGGGIVETAEARQLLKDYHPDKDTDLHTVNLFLKRTQHEVIRLFKLITGQQPNLLSNLIPGRRSYFLPLTYPDITLALHRIEELTQSVDALELLVDLLSDMTSYGGSIPSVSYAQGQIAALGH